MSRLVRAARLVSIATLVSRILGLGRDAVRAALVGAGWLSDALNVAFKIPNLLRDLFAEGAFSGAFVPTLSRTRERQGDAAAFALLSRVLSTMLIHVGLLVVLMIAFAPAIVRLVTSPEFAAQDVFPLAVLLVRLLAPFLLFICLATAAMGALNVFGRFFTPALSPASQNLILVGGGLMLLQLGFGRAEAAVPWACLLLLGGLLQFAMQVPALLRAGWKPRFEPDVYLRRPETREIVRRMLPVAGGLAATHVCILINTWLATRVEGGDSNLYYAFRLVHLPVGLVGVAVGTAVLAEASRRAARGDAEGVRRTLGEAQLVSLAFAAPACAGLVALGEPLARMLFLWGDVMKPWNVARIGVTIQYYAAAVVFYCLVKVTVPVFYARGRVRAPVIASLVAVVANLACALSLHGALQYRGLALAVACGQAANLAVLLWLLARDYGTPHREVVGRIVRIAVASVVCGLAAWATAGLLSADRAAGARLARGLVPTFVGGLAYLAAGWILRSRDILAIFRSLDRR